MRRLLELGFGLWVIHVAQYFLLLWQLKSYLENADQFNFALVGATGYLLFE